MPSSSAAVSMPSARRSPSTCGCVRTFTVVPTAPWKWAGVRRLRSSPGLVTSSW